MEPEKHVIMALQRRIAELETEISRLRELLSQHNIHDTDASVAPCNENTVQMSSLVQALRNQGISVLENMQHHERFVIVDRHIVWYGDADFLSYSKNSDNVIRMVNPEIAADILYAMSGKIDAGVSAES